MIRNPELACDWTRYGREGLAARRDYAERLAEIKRSEDHEYWRMRAGLVREKR